MKKIILLMVLVASTLIGFANTSDQGLLFNVSGVPDTFNINTMISNHYYPAAGLKLTTPGVSIVSGCTPAANGYCVFGASDTLAAIINTTGAGKSLSMNLCLDAAGPLSCQKYTVTQHFAYIANGSPSPTPYVGLCLLDASGAIISCQDAAANSGVNTVLSTAFGIEGIVIDESRHIAYLSSFGGTPNLYQCQINEKGLFSSCSFSVVVTPPNYAGDYGMMTINSSGSIAYVVSEDNALITVLACAINSGVINGNCVSTGATTSSAAVQIALNSSNTVAYIGSYGDDYVTVCDISVDGLTFSNCVNKTGDNGSIAFNGPAGVVLNNTGDMIYIGEYSGTNVYACSTTPNGAATYFDSCFVAKTGLGNLNGIALDGPNKTAYLANFGSVYVCPINSDGTFGTCTLNSDVPGAVNVVISN